MHRILLLTENYPPDRGGMAQSCDRIVRGLRGRGLVVDVAHLSPRYPQGSTDTQFGGRLWRCAVDEDAGHSLNLIWNQLQSASPPSAVLAFGGHCSLLAAPVFAAWWGVPSVVLLRGNDFDAGVLSPRRGWVLREALARAACVVTVSREMQRRVAALYPQTPVHYVANGIDGADWRLHDFDRDAAAQWRARTVADGRRVIGVLGHLKQKKGVTLLLDALRRGGLEGRFHLLLVGEPEAALGEQLASAGGALAATCLPFTDRYALLPRYAACDLVAIPSHYDGMPNVALEAAALGVPLLASRVGGLADLLPADDAYPLQFPPGDRARCSEALALAARLDAATLREFGAQLQRRVDEGFRADSETSRYVALLQAVLGGSAGAGRGSEAPADMAPLGARSE